MRTLAPGEGTQAGSIIGTPAYMPPEQANGMVQAVDTRSDVFGLGAMLCEILTGKPPYVAPTSMEVLLLAAKGELGDAHARLDRCGADAELVQLAKACLAPRQDERPHDAGAVAEAVAAYQAGVEERLRQAELEQVRAHEKGRRRRLAVALATSVVAVVLLGSAGSGAVWLWQQAEEERQQAEVASQEAKVARRQSDTARERAAAARDCAGQTGAGRLSSPGRSCIPGMAGKRGCPC